MIKTDTEKEIIATLTAILTEIKASNERIIAMVDKVDSLIEKSEETLTR